MSEEVAAEVVKPEQPAAPEVAPVETPAEPKEEKPSRVYTQAEVDQIARKVRENTRHRTKREIEAYHRGLREAQAQAAPAAPAKAPEPKADDAPKREQFETYEDYQAALTAHTAGKVGAEAGRKAIEEERRAEAERRSQSEREKQAKEWERRVESARKDLPDFDDVIDQAGDMVIPGPAVQAINESDVGPKLLHYLAKNPAEVERIANLPPSKQAAAIVSLEEKVAKPAKAPSKAPAPIEPVSKGSAEAVKLSTLDPRAAKELDTSEWIRRDRERLMGQRS